VNVSTSKSAKEEVLVDATITAEGTVIEVEGHGQAAAPKETVDLN